MKRFFKFSIAFFVLCVPAVLRGWPQETSKQETREVVVDQQAYLGVEVTAVPPAVAAQVSDLGGNTEGVLVQSVADDSPAARAGLKQHDILVSVNSRKVGSPDELVQVIQKLKSDDKVDLKIYRGGKAMEVSATLASRPEQTLTMERTNFPTGKIWSMPFMEWLKTPDGKKQSAEFDRRERDRQNSPKNWTTFQSLSVVKSADGNYSAKIEYRDEGDKSLIREYSGSREEIRTAINDDEELPEKLKEHLLRSLDQQTPDMFRFEWPRSFHEMFDRNWEDLRWSIDF